MMCRSILHAPCHGEVVKSNFELSILSFPKVSRNLNLDLFFSHCSHKRPLESVTALLSALSTHSPTSKKVFNGAFHRTAKATSHLKKSAPSWFPWPNHRQFVLLCQQLRICNRCCFKWWTESDIEQHPQLLQSLQALCPILVDLVKALQKKDGSLPAEFSDLLNELWRKASAPFDWVQITMWQQSQQQPPLVLNEGTDPFLKSVSVWPHLPRVQERGTYPMDAKSSRQSCRKLGKSHKSLLPGVTLHCQHGK